MNLQDMMSETCLNALCLKLPIISNVYKAMMTTSVLLGNSHFHQFFIFGCILSQIMSTLLLIIIYYKQLTLQFIWWPIIEFIRVCISGIIRIDKLILTQPNIFFNNNPQNLYKAIAFLNIFGFIWAFPIWIFYVSISLKCQHEQCFIFFVVTFVFICLHTISSIPSISKIIRLITVSKYSLEINQNNHNNDQQFGNSFLSSSIDNDNNNDLLSPNPIMNFSTHYDEYNDDEENDDDPILYTAPIPQNDNDHMISSMRQLINKQKQETQDNKYQIGDYEDDDISATEEIDGDDQPEHHELNEEDDDTYDGL